MTGKAKRAGGIIENIIFVLAAIVLLNLFLGKIYDRLQETTAASNFNRMFQYGQTFFESSSDVDYTDAGSQINVPLVGEQGLTRYYNGSLRVINSFKQPNGQFRPNLSEASIKHLAKARTVLCAMKTESIPPGASSSPDYCEAQEVGSGISILVDYSHKLTKITFPPEEELVKRYNTCPFINSSSTSKEQVDYIACIMSSFDKN